MSRVRDIAKFLGLTEANNTTNAVLTSTEDPAGLDSAATLALITGGNAITVTSGVVDHDDTSTQASVNNSGTNFIQDITLDTYGHITAITSADAGGGGGGLGDYGAANSTGTAASATGTDAIAIGETSKSPNTGNISIGANAGPSGLATNHQISIGTYAGDKVGVYNQSVQDGPIYIGAYCGSRMQNDNNNVGIGQGTFHPTMSTQMNINHTVAIGGQNHRQATYGTSVYNVGVGFRAHEDAYNASYNTSIGGLAGKNITGGANNTFVGYNSGYNCTTGGRNIAIGKQNLGGNYSDSIVIGYLLISKGNNTTYIGGSSSIYNQVNTSSWQTTSDSRIKTNVADYTTGLTILDQVDVKTYNYLSDSDIAAAHPELADSDGLVHENLDTTKTVVGLMAQDLETLLPNSVMTRDNGIKTVNKDELFWVMLNSIKELKARVEALENA